MNLNNINYLYIGVGVIIFTIYIISNMVGKTFQNIYGLFEVIGFIILAIIILSILAYYGVFGDYSGFFNELKGFLGISKNQPNLQNSIVKTPISENSNTPLISIKQTTTPIITIPVSDQSNIMLYIGIGIISTITVMGFIYIIYKYTNREDE
jgi:hypothetical protein